MPPVRKAPIILCAAVLASSSVAVTTAKAAGAPTFDAAYSLAVTQICAGALLFDHAHSTGTRAGALAVARDIRASTSRRLVRVADVPAPPELQRTVDRWLSLQRRLAASYAYNWVRIYETIDAARTPKQHAQLVSRLEKFVHAPDALRQEAGRLELSLNVPDCTGGDPGPPRSVGRTSTRHATTETALMRASTQ
jgi:hypothetical protein